MVQKVVLPCSGDCVLIFSWRSCDYAMTLRSVDATQANSSHTHIRTWIALIHFHSLSIAMISVQMNLAGTIIYTSTAARSRTFVSQFISSARSFELLAYWDLIICGACRGVIRNVILLGSCWHWRQTNSRLMMLMLTNHMIGLSV